MTIQHFHRCWKLFVQSVCNRFNVNFHVSWRVCAHFSNRKHRLPLTSQCDRADKNVKCSNSWWFSILFLRASEMKVISFLLCLLAGGNKRKYTRQCWEVKIHGSVSSQSCIEIEIQYEIPVVVIITAICTCKILIDWVSWTFSNCFITELIFSWFSFDCRYFIFFPSYFQ